MPKDYLHCIAFLQFLCDHVVMVMIMNNDLHVND